MKLTIDIPDNLAERLVEQGWHKARENSAAWGPSTQAGILVAKAVHAQRPEPAAGQVWRNGNGHTHRLVEQAPEMPRQAWLVVRSHGNGDVHASRLYPEEFADLTLVSAPDTDGDDQ